MLSRRSRILPLPCHLDTVLLGLEPTISGLRGMYSESAVRVFSKQMTDEVVTRGFTLLSHLSYAPDEASGGGGTRTHNPRLSKHVLQSAVGHVSWCFWMAAFASEEKATSEGRGPSDV
jgi:hypothetical protein